MDIPIAPRIPPGQHVIQRLFDVGTGACYACVRLKLRHLEEPEVSLSWDHLGPSWDHLGTILRHLGPSWDHLGTILGLSWAILGHLGTILGHLGGSLGHLGGSSGHFGGSWRCLSGGPNPFPTPFQNLLFGRACFAAILETSWGRLETVLAHLGRSWGGSWDHLGPSWGVLECLGVRVLGVSRVMGAWRARNV